MRNHTSRFSEHIGNSVDDEEELARRLALWRITFALPKLTKVDVKEEAVVIWPNASVPSSSYQTSMGPPFAHRQRLTAGQQHSRYACN